MTPPVTVTTMTMTSMMTRRPSKWCSASRVRLVSQHTTVRCYHCSTYKQLADYY